MKKLVFFAVCFVSIILYSFYSLEKESSTGIVLEFITYNAHGNNLYIDNVLTGKQPSNDVSVTSILNLPYDTTYAVKASGSDTIQPMVTVSNLGRNPADSVRVYMEISSGYNENTVTGPILSGQTITVTFPNFVYTIGTPYFIKTYSGFSNDTNRVNDTLFQYSIVLPGDSRNVLIEEFTSNSSPACVNNNYSLDTFINSNFGKIAPIKYHSGLLLPDSFYSANPVQVNSRQSYYFVSSVPNTIMDGRKRVQIPYGTSANLFTPYNKSISEGTPVSMQLSDQHIAGDSVKTTINLNVISPVPPGNYKLRICAIELHKNGSHYGTNGEVDFYYIFRKMYPDTNNTNGIPVFLNVGSHQFEYTYYIEPSWVDSMIYTTAFIQNDDNRLILNCAKPQLANLKMKEIISNTVSERSDFPDSENRMEGKREVVSRPADSIETLLNAEIFEGYFPPLGWKVFNYDGYITFAQFEGVNGPTIGGTKCVVMDFYDYTAPGQRDSMYSRRYSGLLSSDSIRFDYAYAQYTSAFIDSLIVKISTDGGLTFPTEIFRAGGQSLATAPQTFSRFVPSNSTQWKTFRKSLNGIVSVNNNSVFVPENYKLMQNYPNPFNPSTTITYELSFSSFISIKVFDMLGKEVATLFNEQQNPGQYNLTFNAENFPSGIYFYSLIADGIKIDTRKMLLLK